MATAVMLVVGCWNVPVQHGLRATRGQQGWAEEGEAGMGRGGRGRDGQRREKQGWAKEGEAGMGRHQSRKSECPWGSRSGGRGGEVAWHSTIEHHELAPLLGHVNMGQTVGGQ